jgi:histone-binding protein RBBP4
VRGMGHSQEGYGLDWDPLNSGRLLTCGDDGKTLLWDVGAPSQKKEKEMSPTGSWSTAKVSDCQWSRKTGNLFGTSGLDGVVSLWDARHPDQALHFALEAVPQNALAFAPFNEHVLCSAGEGGIVYLWDLRAPAQPMHELKGHSEEVYQVQWSPTDDKMLASCGMDRQVIMWDLDRIGEEQSARDAKDGPPELLFIHSGHMATVMDIAWNPHQRFVMASVAEDASLHIWEPAAHVFSEPEQAESPQEDNVVVVE